ncbi:molybdopterin-dependent oxidoreductase [Bradyrhizobium sp. LHD-71]|uniref:molybdopterin-dependent oxidoreductase n=1 Tax=Bradyrhizobium sp. LHD-71 TaxID=3072141 RepID=UPI00280E0256|nr:molybdopterin-dependent oxidoreductase [Bradyrhizobium sp. LHD-71]MDQ8730192.1 molybdopterin-dependent oxidoreductase [Bradyrhizobium sp. LHD-71]
MAPSQRSTEPTRPPMDPAGGVRQIKLQPHEMTERATATKDVFVLAHLGIPHVDPAAWRLTIDGLLARSVTLDLVDLKRRPRKIVEAVHNCCGSPLEPTVATRRAVNVRWGGVDLAELLDNFGIDPRAKFLWSYGLDGGEFAGSSIDWFVKDLPLARLAAGDILIAYELNGAPLPPEHGFPVRLVVPGYYGTNSVKWLWRLHLADRRADSLFTTKLYNDNASAEDVAAGQPPQRPVWAIAPEAIIVTPAPDAVLAVNEPFEITGWAWSFRGIACVEISTDDGASTQRASLEERRGWAWQRFSLTWRPSSPGETRLSARAIESGGTAQPDIGARNAIHVVKVVVR